MEGQQNQGTNMKSAFVALAAFSLLSPFATMAQENRGFPQDVSPDRISIFQTPLQCPAAPEIGCGSRAKPMLLDLERDSSVSEAWLNRAGTRIAVVWKPDSKSEARRTVATKLKEQDAAEVAGKARDEAIAEFRSGKGWYRGTAVDRLSEEEADIIAARLVRRVQAKTVLTGDNAKGLQRAIADALKERFTNAKAKENQDALLKSKYGLQEAAVPYLTKDQIPVLKESIDSGLRPLPNEK
jgi:hypothetical protein